MYVGGEGGGGGLGLEGWLSDCLILFYLLINANRTRLNITIQQNTKFYKISINDRTFDAIKLWRRKWKANVTHYFSSSHKTSVGIHGEWEVQIIMINMAEDVG